ncbi:hypothetical protein LCGC14_1089240 [marine sediment metagenome]|uniref:Peptidase M23 domain-containing protein n=1 Tax=marine sediment metagenome TaxID=412755 RepID=A0A0F9QIW5_9ZZZZ
MRIFRPILSDKLNQVFGESKACIDDRGKVTAKVNDKCISGSQSLYEKLGLKAHNGYDHRTWYGEPVYHSAEFNGWMKTEVDSAGGIGVDVVSNEPILKCTEPNCNEIHYIKIRYWHGKEVIGFDRKEIREGDMIMLADNTGLSSGTHLHWSPKWCNKEGRGIHRNNGYYGAFDVTPYYDNEFVLIVKAIRIEVLNITHLVRIIIDAIFRWLNGQKVGSIGVKNL